MSDLVQKIRRLPLMQPRALPAEFHDNVLRLQVAVESVLEGHGEFPSGWCVACGRDFPCVTLRGVAVALGVREDPED